MLTQSIRLILVEDNDDLREDLAFQLSGKEIEVIAVADAPACYHQLQHKTCDIAILDIGLPGESGLSIARKLRRDHSGMGIIMLTAQGELGARLQGYESGADVYLVKPVDWRELAAQVNALYRGLNRESIQNRPAVWRLTHHGRQLITPAGQPIGLTGLESQVIALLAQNTGKTISRMSLINHLSDNAPHTFDPHRLEVSISRLRQKILSVLSQNTTTPIDRKQLPVVTVRGKGYSFVAPLEINQP